LLTNNSPLAQFDSQRYAAPFRPYSDGEGPSKDYS
jgi:hypothetical protein